MAYDYGSTGLGINNPYKKEGAIRLVAGIIISLLGLYSLLSVPQLVEQDMFQGWVYAGMGLVLLFWGLKHSGASAFQLFRFFVGRSVPTSLAFNQTKSEKDNANAEKKYVFYKSDELEGMLMGRKNATFSEPKGWFSSLIHSIFPKLIFLPYPIRNVTQDVASVAVTTLVAFIAFGLASFVSSSGLAGEAGHIIIPIFSVLLLIYLVIAWRGVARQINIARVSHMQSKTAGSLSKIIAFSILFPVIIGVIYHYVNTKFMGTGNKEQQWLTQISDHIEVFSAWPSLVLLLVLGAGAFIFVMALVMARVKQTTPKTEVSEFRANIQESVHPNEIFINIENIVLANRRYKEIPNRTYRDFDPVLNEQSQGKGSFSGELLIETQPEFKAVEFSPAINLIRLVGTIAGQVLIVIAALLFYLLAEKIVAGTEIYHSLVTIQDWQKEHILNVIKIGSTWFTALIASIFTWQIVSTVGRILSNVSHVFWSEMQFESLLMYMKTEGTFAESKISTGMSIHDSTRSENSVVRSSITPWIVSSRIITSTFAESGSQNLELPRYVMSMQKNDLELDGIVTEIKDFLRQRETIAGFTNTADLQNAENILKVNQVSRDNSSTSSLLDAQAAGALQQNEATESDLSDLNNNEKN